MITPEAATPVGIVCTCGGKTRVLESRAVAGARTRRHLCLSCSARFTTHERRDSEDGDTVRLAVELRKARAQVDALSAALGAVIRGLPK